MSEFQRTWPRQLMARSRPGSWALAAVPFLVASLDAARAPSAVVLIGTLYLLAPFGLLRFGDAAPATRAAIAATNLPLLAALVILGGAAGGIALTLLVATGLAGPRVVETALERTGLPPGVRSGLAAEVGVILDGLVAGLAAVAGFLLAGDDAVRVPVAAIASLVAWIVGVGILRVVERSRRVVAAVASAIAFLVSVAAAAVLGALGAQATIGLALGFALSIEALSGPDRATRDARGVTGLVGAWVAVLIARHWGIFPGGAWPILIAASTAATAYVLVTIGLTRLTTRRRRGGDVASVASIPPVTVIVPVVDDPWLLPEVVAAIRDQTYADVAIVVAAATAVPALERDEDLRVVVPAPAPAGWTATNWAMQAGADSVTGDDGLLLFLDPATELVPVALRRLVEQLQLQRAALASGVPQDAMPTRMERSSIPGYALRRLWLVPAWWSALTHGRPARLAFADDRIVLVERSAYVAAGGHRAHASSRRPGLHLARAVAATGRRVATVHLADVVASAHGGDEAAVIDDWRRTFPGDAGRRSLGVGLATIVAELLAYVVPLVLPLAAWSSGKDLHLLVSACVPLCLLLAGRLALTLALRQPLSTIAWHPVTVGLLLAAQVAGLLDHVADARIGLPSRSARHRVASGS